MKTAYLSLALTIGTMLFCAPSRASDDTPETITANSHALERAVMHQINRHVIFPLNAEAGAMSGIVDVAFAVDINGRLTVKGAQSDNNSLREYVLRKLSNVQVAPNPSGLWSTTHLRFIFKPEGEQL